MKILRTEQDVTEEVLALAEETVDWFDDEPTMPTEDFIDRMFRNPTDCDIEDYNNGAAKKIMRHARKVRRERQ